MEQVVHLPEELRELTWFSSDTVVTAKERGIKNTSLVG